MAVLVGKSDSIQLYSRLLESSFKALDKLYDISSKAGCPYLDDLAVAFKHLDIFRDKVSKDISNYEKLSPSA